MNFVETEYIENTQSRIREMKVLLQQAYKEGAPDDDKAFFREILNSEKTYLSTLERFHYDFNLDNGATRIKKFKPLHKDGKTWKIRCDDYSYLIEYDGEVEQVSLFTNKSSYLEVLDVVESLVAEKVEEGYN